MGLRDRIFVNGIDTPYSMGDEIKLSGVTYMIKYGIGLKWANRDKIKAMGSAGEIPIKVGNTTDWKFFYRDGSIDDGEWMIKLFLDLKTIDGKIIKQENTWTALRLYNFG